MAKVLTVKVAQHGRTFVVRPAEARLHPGDTFKLVNTTGQPMLFRLKSRVPFGSQPRLVEVRERGGTMKKKARRPPWKGSREYEYQILMIESGAKGRGHSDPVIIIDNP
jgi:hypothetical protein